MLYALLSARSGFLAGLIQMLVVWPKRVLA